MIPDRDSFLLEEYQGVGVCGIYVPHRESCHVGLFWMLDGKDEIVHLNATNQILLNRISDDGIIKKFYFNKITNFNKDLIYSLQPLLKRIIDNKVNTLILNPESAVFTNGKFEYADGIFVTNDGSESVINCAVINCAIFVLAILNSFNYKLVDADSWPDVTDESKKKYLDDWLNAQKIATEHREGYYKYNKEIRGKHVLAAPTNSVNPVKHCEAESLSKALISFLKAEHAKSIAP